MFFTYLVSKNKRIATCKFLGTLTHLSSSTIVQPEMVSIADKSENVRVAVAESRILLPAHAKQLWPCELSALTALKTTITLAGINGAKKTSSLIPMCHNIPIDSVKITVSDSPQDVPESNMGEIVITCTAKTKGKTGVEMEAMTGASVAALTLYDMMKSSTLGIQITGVRLLEKTGGKSGHWKASA